MSNYTGLMPLAVLVLSATLLGSASATEQASAPTETAPPPTASADAAVPPLKATAPLRYEVKKGDTLWAIAGYFLKNPWQWPEIWYSNDQIKNPHLIYPGNVLKLIMVGGRPRLVVEGGDEGTADSGPLKLSPKVRSSALANAIPTIPMEAIRDFLKAPQMIEADTLDGQPSIIEFVDHHIVGGSATDVFVKGIAPAQNATYYKVLRKGAPYRDPDSGDVIGYEAIPVGDAEVKRIEKKIATATIHDATREARLGDRLIPLIDDSNYDAYYQPRAPQKDVQGRIISVFDGASQITQYQIVSLNRGQTHGLEPGHVLTVMQAGRTARDPDARFGGSIQLPDTEAGTVMVFKVMPRFSYALVMDATRAIHAADKVVKPR